MTGRRVVLATRNRGKVADVQHLLGAFGLPVDLLAISDLTVPVPEVEETGATFAENAALKAREVSRASGLPTLADDSGLEVDALGGAPGVHSARYAAPAPPGTPLDAANNQKLLDALRGVPPERRGARFVSVVAFADAGGPLGGEILAGEGACPGVILETPRGRGGFGYDPLFFCPELGMTFAEAELADKARVSHRARALARLVPRLRAYFLIANPQEKR